METKEKKKNVPRNSENTAEPLYRRLASAMPIEGKKQRMLRIP